MKARSDRKYMKEKLVQKTRKKTLLKRWRGTKKKPDCEEVQTLFSRSVNTPYTILNLLLKFRYVCHSSHLCCCSFLMPMLKSKFMSMMLQEAIMNNPRTFGKTWGYGFGQDGLSLVSTTSSTTTLYALCFSMSS